MGGKACSLKYIGRKDVSSILGHLVFLSWVCVPYFPVHPSPAPPASAEQFTQPHWDVLKIGFGLGVLAQFSVQLLQ